MCKKMIAASLLSVFLLTISPVQQAWAANAVQVTLPGFTVTLNGQSTSNEYSKYPLIVYKDITYFPMTYYDCRLLGLKTDWTAETGLVIDKNEDYFYEYLREVNNSKNSRKQTAKIADEKITVNGKVIDNSKEEYPLLVFRDITYFPLTWRFAAEEFGWDYHFDQKDGLVIHNDKVKLENPEDEGWEKQPRGAVTGLGGGYYSIQNSWMKDEEDPIVVRLEELQTTQENELNPGEIEFIEISALVNVKNLSMQYEIYKVIGQREELVYRKQLPVFPGNSEMECMNMITTPISYWSKPNLQKGKYILRIGMDLPEVIYYYEYYDEKRHLRSLSAPYPIELANFAERWPRTVLVQ